MDLFLLSFIASMETYEQMNIKRGALIDSRWMKTWLILMWFVMRSRSGRGPMVVPALTKPGFFQWAAETNAFLHE